MKSIKPGRGPSMMGGIMSILVGLFGVGWTIAAIQMGGGGIAFFGVIFVVIAIVQAVYHFRNATNENRHSEYDIVDSGEETDPLNQRFGNSQRSGQNTQSTGTKFCPYCGAPAAGDFLFCNQCGKKLP